MAEKAVWPTVLLDGIGTITGGAEATDDTPIDVRPGVRIWARHGVQMSLNVNWVGVQHGTGYGEFVGQRVRLVLLALPFEDEQELKAKEKRSRKEKDRSVLAEKLAKLLAKMDGDDLHEAISAIHALGYD